MSVRVISEVFQHSESEHAARLVLIALADTASDDGIAWPDQDEIAHKTRLSVSAVRSAIKALGGMNEIEVRQAQRGRRRINVYRIVVGSIAFVEPNYDRLPFALREPFSRPPDSSARQIDDRQNLARRPSESSIPPTPPLYTEPSYEPSKDPLRMVPPLPVNRPVTVNRKPVTDNEYNRATEVLTAFNAVAGTRYESADWISKVIGRVREHPDLTVDQHEAVIRRAFIEPWWQGPPSPSVVYGNAAQFERCLHAVAAPNAPRAPRRERGLTPREMLGMNDWWGSGTPYASPDDAYAAGVTAPGPDVVADAEWSEVTQAELTDGS